MSERFYGKTARKDFILQPDKIATMPATLIGPGPQGFFLQFSCNGTLGCDDRDPILLEPFVEGQILYRFGEEHHDNVVCLKSFLECVFTTQRHPITNVAYSDTEIDFFDEVVQHISRALDTEDDWHCAALMGVQQAIAEQAIWDGRSLHWPASVPIISRDHLRWGDYLGKCEELVVPSEVVAIDEYACSGNRRLRFVVFAPNSQLRTIGLYAFQGTRVQRIVLPSALETIGAGAFCNSKLRHVLFTGPITTIDDDAFKNSDLTAVVLPASLRIVNHGTFSGCTKLTVVTFARGSTCTEIDSFAFCHTRVKAIHVPASVKTIGMFAFSDCDTLHRLTFAKGSQLKQIGSHAFKGTNLRKAILPAELRALGAGVFLNCMQLTSVTLPSKLQQMGESCFKRTALTAVTLPDAFTFLEKETFYGCTKLQTIVLGNNLRHIDSEVFVQTAVQTIAIPDAVVCISNRAFCGCSALAYLHFNATSRCKEIGASAFAGCALEEVHLPRSIQYLRHECFYKNYALRALTLPPGNALQCMEGSVVSHTQVWRIENIPRTARTDKSFVSIETELVYDEQ